MNQRQVLVKQILIIRIVINKDIIFISLPPVIKTRDIFLVSLSQKLVLHVNTAPFMTYMFSNAFLSSYVEVYVIVSDV
jgi:hypothetical protein